MRIDQLVTAEQGWKAIFSEHDGGESQSRILGWAVIESGDEIVGVIVDPGAPSQIILATDAVSPEGGTFIRYRYVAPEPPPLPVPPPAPAPDPADEVVEQVKGRFKRK
ncbi:MAG TPA: hypothetical protein VH416_04010 [Gaiellaceae bacterium]